MSIFFKNLPQLYPIKISFMEMFDSLITADFFTASHSLLVYYLCLSKTDVGKYLHNHNK